MGTLDILPGLQADINGISCQDMHNAGSFYHKIAGLERNEGTVQYSIAILSYHLAFVASK